jgi:hypothetical protein
MTPQAMAIDAPTAAVTPATPCERCGTFSDALTALGSAKICRECIARLVANERFWPSGYLIGVGVLLNPTLSMVLVSLNHRRLGDTKQARNWLIGAVMLGVAYTTIVLTDAPIPGGVLFGASAGAGFTIGRTFQLQWEVLKSLGAKRANVWLPPLFALLVLLGLGVIALVGGIGS